MEAPKSGITFLKTKDLIKTNEFYTQVMNFELVLDQGKCRIYKICPNCYLGFCLTDGGTGSEEVILTFEVEDVDGFCVYLESRDIEIELRPRQNQYYNIYQMFIRDPNGYLLEIQRFLDPNWNIPQD
jgi:catechol 2,3-dioxygenase-like lactoylglutathione lyase family enzyme